MNKYIKLAILLLFSLVIIGCDKKQAKEEHEHKSIEGYYTCSMHPQIKEPMPGKCPICHMNLTKVEIEKDNTPRISNGVKQQQWQCENYPEVVSDYQDTCPIDGSLMIPKKYQLEAGKVVGKVKLRKAQLSHFNPDFFPVTSMEMTKRIRLLGSVLQSEEKESSIPARISGRVEKVYVKSTGSMVKEGDPVVDLYSPALITAGEEYLLAKRSYVKNKTKEFQEMLNQSIERLKLWGIRDEQYESWYHKGKVPKKITIFSNTTGIVRKKYATVGKYFKEGQNFFELSDLTDVWVEMDVYEYDASLVEIGQRVALEFSSIPGKIIMGEIDFISPILDQRSRTLKIRTTIKNPEGKLKPGMIASAVLEIKIKGQPLVIPRSAIVDTGKRKVVWVKKSEEKFEAKTIQSGHESEGYVEIKSGLKIGDEVVIEGNFLLDAQAQLFGGYEDMQ